MRFSTVTCDPSCSDNLKTEDTLSILHFKKHFSLFFALSISCVNVFRLINRLTKEIINMITEYFIFRQEHNDTKAGKSFDQYSIE